MVYWYSLLAMAFCFRINANDISNEIVLTKEVETSIAEDTETVPTGFPYVVSIQENTKGYYKHLCGGAIIDVQFVLTAAHCVTKPTPLEPDQLFVVGGSHTLNSMNETRFRVDRMKIHPDFKLLRGHDIVLLRVKPKFQLDNVRFSIIKYKEIRRGGGINATFLGWGRLKRGEKKDLDLVPFETIKDTECRLTHKFVFLTRSEMCAVHTGIRRGACDGDSGGPLVDGNKHYLYGLLSYGRKACQKGQPYAFTRISMYGNWIRDEMNEMNVI
ncbi:venom peptide isomerase heavy chain [Drosophila obscura]|uniref:venom peptide isomerase heavy chain n=1 Tax=Drosophila obscura TaxID=7282 RepID=UPI000B9FF204|nr:venom peptide isomerase heavy chain [Drosophila obscura]